jgi:hypothetical protein
VIEHVNEMESVVRQHMLKRIESDIKDQQIKMIIKKRSLANVDIQKAERNFELRSEELLQEFMLRTKIRNLFDKYEPIMREFFRFYCTFGKHEFGTDAQFRSDNMA